MSHLRRDSVDDAESSDLVIVEQSRAFVLSGFEA